MTMRRSFTALVLQLLLLCTSAFPGEDHPWMEPTETDVRSPCPAVNALANHGFIPRSGRGVSLQGVVQAASYVYGTVYVSTFAMATAALVLSGAQTTWNGLLDVTFDLDDLFSRGMVGDASAFILDAEFEPGARKPNLCLLQELLNTGGDPAVLTRDDIVAFKLRRILDSRKHNPDAFSNRWQPLQQFANAGDAAGIMVMSDDDNYETCNKAYVEEWVEFGRLPAGFVPRSDRGLPPIAIEFSEASLYIGTQLFNAFDVGLENVPDAPMCLDRRLESKNATRA